ncbi:hypothetical protein DP939_34875 [Spongiactinospora rosea]|uniref:Uncharacterized protein n=1 Tax=Spongiactinospora rosea TaxID=2248750 RepID=A0A366LPI8_9ACTN|nr:hypothetical protein [Spongiactinospora rosea]RBQ15560.1 hypothetical protein DP939_34875 [Spongiactinospora rosea]
MRRPPPLPGQHQGTPQQPLYIRQVGKSVTAPAWTVGQILALIFTGGMAYPWIWARRRRRTTITRHR